MRRPRRFRIWEKDAFESLNRSGRMVAKRSKRLNGAFLWCGCVMTADAGFRAPESIRSESMVLDALGMGADGLLSPDKKLSGGFRIFDADDEDGG